MQSITFDGLIEKHVPKGSLDGLSKSAMNLFHLTVEKKKKTSCLASQHYMHSQPDTDNSNDKKKPAVILYYNSTKTLWRPTSFTCQAGMQKILHQV